MNGEIPTVTHLGIEPALKEAVDVGKQNILVLATPLTIHSPKYQAQQARFINQANIYSLPCSGLADLIEGGTENITQIKSYLTKLLTFPQREQVDAIVLGCTHYPFIAKLIQQQFAQSPEIYTGLGNNLKHQLAKRHLLQTDQVKQNIEFMSSKHEPAELTLYQQLFDYGLD
ncbi:hypothetical protein LH506_08740 [Lapidilactobacillus dextrinicus]|nr:hypothetical protein LH506_08740 [Lapidilactobacillus dextrinicus]